MIKSLKEIMSPFVLCNLFFKVPAFLRFGILLFFGRGEEKDNSNKTIFRIQKR